MYDSLKPWVNVSFQLIPYVGKTARGDYIYSDPIEYFCYPVSDLEEITTVEGNTVVSTSQLYLDTNVSIKYHDKIVFEGLERLILRIQTFYREGVPDVRVVYL